MHPLYRSDRHAVLKKCACWLPLALVLIFSGCATAPVTFRTHEGADARVAKLKTVVVAPLDTELSELTAGGVSEKRDDWTETATANLTTALAAETGWKPNTALTADQKTALRAEAEDVQALLRAMTLNYMFTAGPGPVVSPFPVLPGATLTYNTGPLKDHAAKLGCDAVLFVFVRDSYATAGRKSLLALSFIGAAFTGVVIVPSMGVDVMSAALVEQDGTVLWFNLQVGGSDPRTPEGAREVVKKILTGLPRHS